MAFALSQADLKFARHQNRNDGSHKAVSDARCALHSPIAENLCALQEEINRYTYRAIGSPALDAD